VHALQDTAGRAAVPAFVAVALQNALAALRLPTALAPCVVSRAASEPDTRDPRASFRSDRACLGVRRTFGPGRRRRLDYRSRDPDTFPQTSGPTLHGSDWLSAQRVYKQIAGSLPANTKTVSDLGVRAALDPPAPSGPSRRNHRRHQSARAGMAAGRCPPAGAQAAPSAAPAPLADASPR